MIPLSASPLSDFSGWVRSTDDHAEHHLALIEQAQRQLSDGGAGSERAQALADKLERWRYQHARRDAADEPARDAAFAAALEATAARLAGRANLPPRGASAAVRGQAPDAETLRRAFDALDTAYPLDHLTEEARRVTAEAFGGDDWPVLLYAPLYVSSHCVNHCTYCGFRYPLAIERRHLGLEEVEAQADLLQREGFEHLLVVGGDFAKLTTADYYAELLLALTLRGVSLAVEIAAQSTEAYGALVDAGACGVTLYQETYDKRLYAEYHPRGPKADYLWRLEAPDRAAEAGVGRLGLGVLLGLADPVADVTALMRHGAYLTDRFPKARLAFSLPRIHEAPAGFTVRRPVSDDALVRYYGALRLAFPRAELVLSTREPAPLRDRLARVGVTQMSAGSTTTPGGYGADGPTTGEQFPVTDRRSPAEVAKSLLGAGKRVVWRRP